MACHAWQGWELLFSSVLGLQADCKLPDGLMNLFSATASMAFLAIHGPMSLQQVAVEWPPLSLDSHAQRFMSTSASSLRLSMSHCKVHAGPSIAP